MQHRVWMVVIVVAAAACGGKSKKPAPEPISNTSPAPVAAPVPAEKPAPALPCDTELVRRVYATSTTVPECDEYLHAFAALTCCDKAGPALDGLEQGLEATMESWDAWKDMQGDALEAARKAAAPGCQAGTDALRNTAQALECTVP